VSCPRLRQNNGGKGEVYPKSGNQRGIVESEGKTSWKGRKSLGISFSVLFMKYAG
jgi:hypothetical protein